MLTGPSFNYGVVVEQEEGLPETLCGVAEEEQANMFMDKLPQLQEQDTLLL
jgi:hypothetical protein